MKLLASTLIVALTVAVMIALVASPRDDAHRHTSPKDMTDLAARVNSACKPGYALNDWTTGDDFDPVPAGTVKVTCARTTEPYDIYYVAVAR